MLAERGEELIIELTALRAKISEMREDQTNLVSLECYQWCYFYLGH